MPAQRPLQWISHDSEEDPTGLKNGEYLVRRNIDHPTRYNNAYEYDVVHWDLRQRLVSVKNSNHFVYENVYGWELFGDEPVDAYVLLEED